MLIGLTGVPCFHRSPFPVAGFSIQCCIPRWLYPLWTLLPDVNTAWVWAPGNSGEAASIGLAAQSLPACLARMMKKQHGRPPPPPLGWACFDMVCLFCFRPGSGLFRHPFQIICSWCAFSDDRNWRRPDGGVFGIMAFKRKMHLRLKYHLRTRESDLRKLVIDFLTYLVIDLKDADVSTNGGLVLED